MHCIGDHFQGRRRFFCSLHDPKFFQRLFYGGIVIALRIYFRYIGLQHAKAAEIAISSAIVPISSLFFAYLFLGKVSDLGQWLGSSVIFLGILIALISKLLEKEKVVLQQPIGFSGN